jgi:competence protein ComEA
MLEHFVVDRVTKDNVGKIPDQQRYFTDVARIGHIVWSKPPYNEIWTLERRARYLRDFVEQRDTWMFSGWVTPDGKVNLNESSLEELQIIPGIGQRIAEHIMNRRQGTPFRSVGEALNIQGMVSATYQEIRSRAVVAKVPVCYALYYIATKEALLEVSAQTEEVRQFFSQGNQVLYLSSICMLEEYEGRGGARQLMYEGLKLQRVHKIPMFVFRAKVSRMFNISNRSGIISAGFHDNRYPASEWFYVPLENVEEVLAGLNPLIA